MSGLKAHVGTLSVQFPLFFLRDNESAALLLLIPDWQPDIKTAKKKSLFFFFAPIMKKRVFFGLNWVVNVKCVSPGLVQPCHGSPPTTEFLDPLRFSLFFFSFFNAWIEFILSCYHRATNHSSPLACKSSPYPSCLYPGDSQNFLCCTESQRSTPPPPKKKTKKRCTVILNMISFAKS